MANNETLKSLVDHMCEVIDSIAEKTSLPEKTGDAARMEIGMFMMYLAASDGQIRWDEARTISEICRMNITPNNVGDFIRKNNIYSTEFEQKIPITFEIMVRIDNVLLDRGIDASGSEAMLETYKAVGEALIKSDGEVDDNEMTDYRIYINMLEEYRDNNYKGANGSAFGFTKSGGSVSAPSKGGVIAPKKG